MLLDGGNSAGGINAITRSFTINNAVIQNCIANMGGAIYSDGGLTVTGGLISGNTAGSGGGIARVANSALNISGGEIRGITSRRYGGAFSLYDCTINVSGGEISGNTAAHANGGGIQDYWGSAINVTGGAIIGNHAPEGDGGIYIGDLTKVAVASDALFSGNTARHAFWMTDPGDIALHNANIHTTSRSAPPAGNRAFAYLFNNYDVNYTKGNTQDLLQLFTITVTDDGNGIAGSDKSVAYHEEIVTLLATPYIGYTLKEWIIISGNIAAINSDGAFIMPDGDVVIQAIFEPVPTTGGVMNNNKITGNRVIHYNYDYNYDNYTTIEELPPPLAGLPPENNIPSTGKPSSTPYVILGASMIIFVIFIRKSIKTVERL